MARKYKQGFFKPVNKHKYDGNFNDIVYRSSYELKFMNWCDRREDVVRWSSEETVVPYTSPVDNKKHRYYLDFKVSIRNSDGEIRTYLVEIKPKTQTIPPVPPKKQSRKYIEQVQTYLVNQAKWKSAGLYAEQRNLKFIILTEDHLF